ncbi:AfsA-related hotdog domain-containing protein [Streptomyces buecherae]|uniref:AfsA-related hotdog domain-containing protein n=1 Tax=Streptomyces buecherae TaxID=2763006 RepID=UPI001C9B6D82|nr:AfsA-related hotdog domain-containing protein [Streptomyces buecherae]
MVVSEPAEAAPYGRFVTQLPASTYHRVFAAEGGDHLSGMLLLEAMRQTALLAAGRTYGLTPSRATMATSRVFFRARAPSPAFPSPARPFPGRSAGTRGSGPRCRSR